LEKIIKFDLITKGIWNGVASNGGKCSNVTPNHAVLLVGKQKFSLFI
jgi:hypothetical protein